MTLDELQIDESFEVIKWTLDLSSMTCALDLIAVGPEIDDWDPSEEGDPGLIVEFGFLSDFSKDGTALDPVAEGGGKAGDGALVFVATKDAAGIASTPSGWSLIASVGPTSGLAFAAFARNLDGSEGPTTFLAGAGGIIQINFQKIFPANWTFNDFISTGIPPIQLINHASPVLYLLFGAISTQDISYWAKLGDLLHPDGDDLAGDDDVTAHAVAGGPTLVVRRALLRDYETAPSAYGLFLADKGTNAMMTIALTPRL